MKRATATASPRKKKLPPRPRVKKTDDLWLREDRAVKKSKKVTPLMGWDGRVLVVLALSLLLIGCPEAPTSFATVCDHANDIVQRCGATVPMLTDTPCTGISRFISQCVADHAPNCDELASLVRNVDRCFPDAGEDGAFPEAESLPFPTPDRLDGGSTP